MTCLSMLADAEATQPHGQRRGVLVRGDSAQTLHHTARASKLQQLLRSFSRNRTTSDESSPSVQPSTSVSQQSEDVETDADAAEEQNSLLRPEQRSDSIERSSTSQQEQRSGRIGSTAERPAEEQEVFREAESASKRISDESAAESADQSPDRAWWKDRNVSAPT